MNQMHLLRRWARDNIAAQGSVELSEEERQALAKSINQGLAALDEFWETVAGRKLTDEEKGLVD